MNRRWDILFSSSMDVRGLLGQYQSVNDRLSILIDYMCIYVNANSL
jgi:hypothetical protein